MCSNPSTVYCMVISSHEFVVKNCNVSLTKEAVVDPLKTLCLTMTIDNIENDSLPEKNDLSLVLLPLINFLTLISLARLQLPRMLHFL